MGCDLMFMLLSPLPNTANGRECFEVLKNFELMQCRCCCVYKLLFHKSK